MAGQTLLDTAIVRRQPSAVLGLGLTLRGVDVYWALNAQRSWLNRLELGMHDQANDHVRVNRLHRLHLSRWPSPCPRAKLDPFQDEESTGLRVDRLA